MSDQLGHYSFEKLEPTFRKEIEERSGILIKPVRTRPHLEGGAKYDAGKPRMDLISSLALEELGKVLDYGARVKGYGENNWRKGITWGRLLGATLRHLVAFMRGEDLDKESGLSHLSHAFTNVMMLIEFFQTRRDLDDRWRIPNKEGENG